MARQLAEKEDRPKQAAATRSSSSRSPAAVSSSPAVRQT